MKTAMVSEKYLSRSASSRLLCRQAELDHFPPLLRGNPLHTFRELGRYVKLNYFCHEFSPSGRLFFRHVRFCHDFHYGWPSHSHPH